MLMHRQPLTSRARTCFRVFRDPFGEISCAEDLYTSPDIGYIREAMYQAARHDDFLAVIGESGSGKSTLRRDLDNRLAANGAPVITIQPYVLAMEDNDRKGKTLKSDHIAESVLAAIAPSERPRLSQEARFRQLHDRLKESHQAGTRHVLIIEEAHSLPIPTLKHLKRLRELETGFSKLLSIILIGQPELAIKLSPKNTEVREVAQRISIVTLPPIPSSKLPDFLAHRLGRAGSALADVADESAVDAMVSRLTLGSGERQISLLYPLAIGNLFTAAMNLAASLGETRITADIIRGI
ncbi:ExeA protein [Alphaproteobacteria bacterium]|nr:ExeA protein [Alphaproteobacteria bacterium]